jgi:hypothetical protein
MIDNSTYFEEAQNNAQILSWALSELSSFETDSYEKFVLYRDNYLKILELLKTLKPLLQEDRDHFYNQLQDIAILKRRKQEERKQKRINASRHKKEFILLTIQDAIGYISSDPEGLKRADELLRLARDSMRSGNSGGSEDHEPSFHTDDCKMIKSDLEQCRQLWSEVKGMIYLKRNEVFETNYLERSLDLKIISELVLNGSYYEAVKQIKAAHKNVSSHPMTPENTAFILNSLQKYWNESVERIKERKTEWESKRKEKEIIKDKLDQKQIELEKLIAERERKKKEKALFKSQNKTMLREHKQRMIKQLKKLTEKQEMELLKWETEKDEQKTWDIEKKQILNALVHKTKKLELENEKTKKKQQQKQMLKRNKIKTRRQRDHTGWKKL